jgi:hypothetical protein
MGVGAGSSHAPRIGIDGWLVERKMRTIVVLAVIAAAGILFVIASRASATSADGILIADVGAINAKETASRHQRPASGTEPGLSQPRSSLAIV